MLDVVYNFNFGRSMVNIFFTDWDPIVAARDSCDSYVIKIPVEVGTMLSAVHWRTGYDGPVGSGQPLQLRNNIVLPAVGPYRDSKVIKSSSETYRWLVKSTGNYDYAIRYGLELIAEYRRRYDNKHHLAEGVLLWLEDHLPDIPVGPMTTDVGLAMPDAYKDRTDPTESYKMYLVCEKSGIMKWERGLMPDWYRDMTLRP